MNIYNSFYSPTQAISELKFLKYSNLVFKKKLVYAIQDNIWISLESRIDMNMTGSSRLRYRIVNLGINNRMSA